MLSDTETEIVTGNRNPQVHYYPLTLFIGTDPVHTLCYSRISFLVIARPLFSVLNRETFFKYLATCLTYRKIQIRTFDKMIADCFTRCNPILARPSSNMTIYLYRRKRSFFRVLEKHSVRRINYREVADTVRCPARFALRA